MADEKKTQLIEVQTRAEFDAALAAATGPVVVDFVAADCGACEEEKPALAKLASECATATILLVDEAKVGAELADAYDVSGTPTLLYADSADDFKAKKVQELEPDSALLRRKLKCSRR